MWCVMYILVFLVVVEVEGVVVGVDEAPGEHGEAPAEAAPATARAEGRRRRPALRRRRQAPAVVGLEPRARGRGERRAGEMAPISRGRERVEDVGQERRRRRAPRVPGHALAADALVDHNSQVARVVRDPQVGQLLVREDLCAEVRSRDAP